MKIAESTLPGVLIIEPAVYSDDRGFFMELFQQSRYEQVGIQGPFVQDNISYSRQGVLRGLHFQEPDPQGKLVSVLSGEVFDVAVDIRLGSPTYGKWAGFFLSAENKRQLWIPEGFAHGLCITSETALFIYKCTTYYSPHDEYAIRWDDEDIGIQWPLSDVVLSTRDKDAPTLDGIPRKFLPVYAGADE